MTAIVNFFFVNLWVISSIFVFHILANKSTISRGYHRTRRLKNDLDSYEKFEGEIELVSPLKKTVLPLVINTWNIVKACTGARDALWRHESAVDAVVAGCSLCEDGSCGSFIGRGGSPDEHGETTLDAMIMDGDTMDVGSVGSLRNIQSAIAVARAVMRYTKHTLLVGDLATEFAVSMGFEKINLQTNVSYAQWKDWMNHNCQPNFWQNVHPDPKLACGPYRPHALSLEEYETMMRRTGQSVRYNRHIDSDNHDTIGMVVVTSDGSVASGTTTNGAIHKIPGRVGDSPIVGAGSYAQNDVGGAACTGDGDVMMRFSPSFHVVQKMSEGLHPTEAAHKAINLIHRYYPQTKAAIVAANVKGEHGVACIGFTNFQYNVVDSSASVRTVSVKCSR